MGRPRTKLNAKIRKFCLIYAKTWNGAEAYREAFPTASEQYAKHYAYKMLQRDDVQAEVQKCVDEALGPFEKDLTENVQFWVNMRDDENEKAANRLKASEHLAKYRGLFVDKKEVTGNVAVQILDDL